LKSLSAGSPGNTKPTFRPPAVPFDLTPGQPFVKDLL